MTGPDSPFPPRLRSKGGTPLEQRLLNAGARQEPSRELTERMAKAIGVFAPTAMPAPAPAPEPSGAALGTGAAAPKAAASSSALLPWLSGAVIVAATGIFVATRPSESAPPRPAPRDTPVVAPPSLVTPPATQAGTVPPASESDSPAKVSSAGVEPTVGAARVRPDRTDGKSGVIAEQIALVDAASAAVSNGSGERALSLVREYQTKYPAGSFRPEVSALRIEALMLLGRRDEARAAAERFVTQYKGPLAERVARVAQLKR